MLNLMTERDRFTAVPVTSGFARLTNSKMPKEEIEKLPLDKYFGKRGWTDPAEWNYLD